MENDAWEKFVALSSAPKKLSIPDKLNQLDQDIDSLEDAVRSLAERMMPFLTPGAEVPVYAQNPTNEPIRVAVRLSNITKRVREIELLVNSLRDNLEI